MGECTSTPVTGASAPSLERRGPSPSLIAGEVLTGAAAFRTMAVVMHGVGLLQVGSMGVLAAVFAAAASILLTTLHNGVPPMPSSARVRRRITSLIARFPEGAYGTAGGSVAELGSGWGTLTLALARALPAATVTGFESSLVPFLCSLLFRRLFGSDNLRFRRRDFHTISLAEADLVVCYLSPDAMARLRPKFEAELKPTALVVSHTFALPAWRATAVEVADDLYRTPIYLYRVDRCRSATVASRVDIDG